MSGFYSEYDSTCVAGWWSQVICQYVLFACLLGKVDPDANSLFDSSFCALCFFVTEDWRVLVGVECQYYYE